MSKDSQRTVPAYLHFSIKKNGNILGICNWSVTWKTLCSALWLLSLWVWSMHICSVCEFLSLWMWSVINAYLLRLWTTIPLEYYLCKSTPSVNYYLYECDMCISAPSMNYYLYECDLCISAPSINYYPSWMWYVHIFSVCELLSLWVWSIHICSVCELLSLWAWSMHIAWIKPR